MVAKLFSFIGASVLGVLYYWLVLPPLNLTSPVFWIGMCLYFGAMWLINIVIEETNGFSIFFGVLSVICLAVVLIGGVGSSTVFNAKRYQQLMIVEDGDFNEDISQIEINQLPILDRNSAERLGDRRMGAMVDLVSQFEVANDYTQINVSNKPIRTTPLEYGGLFKWFNNKNNGVPGYINVDMVTQEAELVKLNGEGMKYVPSAYFNKDLKRHLRFKYPTYIFEDFSFEIDDQGNPWYIIPVIEKNIFMFGGRDVKSAIIFNPINGDSTYYTMGDIPQWVDRVYPEELATKQLDWYGMYKNGWLNSWVAQKGVLKCTKGYNYIAKDDDIWLYTGFTSVGKDESNVGFMLVNLRTKEAKYYACPGAEEYSAMDSAEGAVKNFGYSATFPLLINVNNEPTYLMALKDDASLVKMYAVVNVESYQVVSTGTSLNEAFTNYAKALTNIGKNIEASDLASIGGKVIAIEEAVKDGYTYYYLKLDSDNNIYVASISVSDLLPFTAVDDDVLLNYIESSSEVKQVMHFSK